jgi:hypothetical protein
MYVHEFTGAKIIQSLFSNEVQKIIFPKQILINVTRKQTSLNTVKLDQEWYNGGIL